MVRLFLVSLLLLPCYSLAQKSTRWTITRTQWSAQDEVRFGDFITRIGLAVSRRECGTVSSCLRSVANPYQASDPPGLRFFADCADLPYLLRSYFAWKNGLPMSIQSSVSPRQSGDNSDVRYTKFGNYVTGRYDIPDGADAVEHLNSIIINTTWSASFRLMGSEEGGYYSDFYPVKLGRSGIRPGTVIYDPNGHVAIVYRVTDDGRIYYIDSHPDNSLTSGMYTPKFVRSFPFQGAGFKNFRPLKIVGDEILGARNATLSDYSLEQFYGNRPDPGGAWQKGQFIFKGLAYNYYEYVRLVMAKGELKIDPISDLRANLGDICVSLRDRVQAVSAAIRAGIDKKAHPERLPQNIYGTDGEWEAYASPARDARLKVAYMDLLAQAQQMIQRWRSGDPVIIYPGSNLAADMLNTYYQDSRSCQFTYTTSSGGKVTLNTDDIRRRLFDLSFDPYHCVELRWGAKTPQELSSCQDDANKREWYLRERWLRYQWERRYDARMDYSLDELTGPKPGAGIANPPDVDVVSYLKREGGVAGGGRLE